MMAVAVAVVAVGVWDTLGKGLGWERESSLFAQSQLLLAQCLHNEVLVESAYGQWPWWGVYGLDASDGDGELCIGQLHRDDLVCTERLITR